MRTSHRFAVNPGENAHNCGPQSNLKKDITMNFIERSIFGVFLSML